MSTMDKRDFIDFLERRARYCDKYSEEPGITKEASLRNKGEADAFRWLAYKIANNEIVLATNYCGGYGAIFSKD